MEIKIQSTRFIKPSKSTPENRRYFKLSLLDQLAPSAYINLIFFYKASGGVNISDRVGQLVKSLSEVLTSFYPLAGRITEDGLAVDCSDQGVEYFETRVSARLDEFLAHGSKMDHVHRLVATPDQVRNTLVIIQVNVFDCGSLVIGVSASHKVTDACNLVRFINAWASTNRTRPSNGPFSPSFDNLDSLFRPRENLSNEHSPVSVELENITVTKRFVFDRTAIRKLRSKTGLENSTKHSRVTLVASLVWKALILIDKVNCGRFRDCLLAPAMNLRGKVGSPISESSFGNVWAPYPIRLLQKEMEPKFVDLVSMIEDTTKSIIAWLATASGEEICKHAMASYAKVNEELKHNKFCMFTSWCRFPIYEADFGWGKPDWARALERSLELVTLMDDKHGDAIEAWVSLNEKDMYVFEQDRDILAFTTSTISEVA
uniref:pelargonidin 3-O-(6-caffeoylglucoside) 5-O-(6-O-malonylglucoside) 4'''-malonyltransferase-like n=1 Tax=Erigeron canadensis TaxID=72917 RepID=UPI001CB9B5D8|nr:pelargonidin 3-O-(6-caffeoylglucoside) 5-O-(6-O-malonylglucoside) 4'''-malonyltransferase-like [Erigeron canadensis]